MRNKAILGTTLSTLAGTPMLAADDKRRMDCRADRAPENGHNGRADLAPDYLMVDKTPVLTYYLVYSARNYSRIRSKAWPRM